jgi:hypothetical protein
MYLSINISSLEYFFLIFLFKAGSDTGNKNALSGTA